MEQADYVHLVRVSELASAENSHAYRRSVALFAALGYAWVLGCLVLALGMVAWAVPPLLAGRGLTLSRDGLELGYDYDTRAERTGIARLLVDEGMAERILEVGVLRIRPKTVALGEVLQRVRVRTHTHLVLLNGTGELLDLDRAGLPLAATEGVHHAATDNGDDDAKQHDHRNHFHEGETGCARQRARRAQIGLVHFRAPH